MLALKGEKLSICLDGVEMRWGGVFVLVESGRPRPLLGSTHKK